MRAPLDVTEAPVIMGHSACRAVDHVRNVPDEVLTRLSANGRVCMICFVPDFISDDCRQWTEEVRQEMRRQGLNDRDDAACEAAEARHANGHAKPRATLRQVADYVDHARKVAGVEHVGIGGDYDGCPDQPLDLEEVSGDPALFAELIDRGWSDHELTGLAGGNVLRALREAERVSARLSGQRPPSRATSDH